MLALAATPWLNAASTPDFNRDVRPILSEHCFKCHGPDQAVRKAGLRLDTPEGATAERKGVRAIVPGKPKSSALVARIYSSDPDEVMPPPEHPRKLNPAQKKLLERWVAEGAPYRTHWAFAPLERPSPPPVKKRAWARNAVDRFILARLEQEGLAPSPPADRTTLIRRVTLDLTGLPPAPATVEAFLADTSPDAFEKVVDRLLQSPHYGERMALDWLDAARFADSNGYQVDRDREMYAWRDWVIDAFNRNLPFDQFTIEQLAGDLLPNASLAQRIATGFHRNHMMNEEGGIIPEEFLAEYTADRVETTGAIWLGQTLHCARCHDHKYDPFTQRDFYSLKAFFHNVSEKGIGDYNVEIRRNNPPMLQLPAPALDTKLATLKHDLDAATNRLAAVQLSLTKEQPAWEQRLRAVTVTWEPLGLTAARVGETNLAPASPSGSLPPGSPPPARFSIPIPPLKDGTNRLTVEFQLAGSTGPGMKTLRVQWPADGVTAALRIAQIRLHRLGEETNAPLPLRTLDLGRAGPLRNAPAVPDAEANGSPPALVESPPAALLQLEDQAGTGRFRLELPLRPGKPTGAAELSVLFTSTDAEWLATPGVLAIAKKETAARSGEETKQIAAFHASTRREFVVLTDQVATLRKQIEETDLQIPTTLVMEELPSPRRTHLLMRGAYDQKGDEVFAATPGVLPPLGERPRNRLGLAQWLVAADNPLPARVTVNRFWQGLFGTGLVRTAEDFGSQGEAPSHPELLDWLAAELIRTGWDMKAMMRLLVTSATYAQSSRLSPQLRERDPDNRLLARGARFRLQAELVRDQALAASGLLVARLGGPSVRPYHPPGLYEQVVAGKGPGTYTAGKGDELFRRSLYTYWKRSVPNPAMLLFDAPFRETCALRRPRTNTPLQALNLMNDPTYVEAARFLARRMLREGGDTLDTRLTYGFRLVTGRPPRSSESGVLAAAHLRALNQFQADPGAANALLRVGDAPALPEAVENPASLAALTTVASTLLNLDETIMKE